MTVFEMIWNCRKKMKTRTVNGAFWRYLKRVGNAENKNENKDAYACIMTLFKTVFETAKIIFVYMFYLIKGAWSWGGSTFPWKCENRDGVCCILTLYFGTVGKYWKQWTLFWPAGKILKAMNQNGAFCSYLIRYFDLQTTFRDPRVLPTPTHS